MDAFEKWWEIWMIPVAPQDPEGAAAAKEIVEDAFRAGMRAAAEIVRQNAKEIALQVRPYEPISIENVRLLMEDSEEACAALAHAILAEAEK